MTDKDLEECKALLDHFSIPYDMDYIPLTSGGNSIIMNPNFKYKNFIGASLNVIAEAVAKKLNKKTKWIE